MPTRKRPYARPVVFYDGGCNLCSREIAHYRSLDRNRRVEWIDINAGSPLLPALGLSRERAMKRLHVVDGDGVLRDGAPAFVAMWRALPYYRVLAVIIDLTRTVGMLDAVYSRFAGWRYTRRHNDLACRYGPEAGSGLQPVPVRVGGGRGGRR